MGDTTDIAISRRLELLAEEAGGETVTLAWILEQLRERAFGLFLLILALPCCIPFLYGVPQVVALPLMFISAHLVFGYRTPWLPARLAAREIEGASLSALAARAGPWLSRLEALSKPRLAALTRPPIDRIIGVALVAFCASILVPLPLTNTVPAVAVVAIAMGLLQRDGILVILGALLGTAWIASLVFAGASLISLIRGWIGV